MSLEIVRSARTSGSESLGGPMPITTPASGGSLLPEPGASGLDGAQDAMSMMYELVAKQGNSAMASGEIGVDTQNREQETEAQNEATALKQQEADEAKLETGSLFGSICHIFDSVGTDLAHGRIEDIPGDVICGAVNTLDSPHLLQQLEDVAPQVAEYVGIAAAVIGGAALTAATCGAGAVVVAAVVIALSASGMFVSTTKCLGKDSAYIGLGLEVASVVVSCGASSGMAADSALQSASEVADAASGGADIAAGASTVETGHEQANIVDDSANVQQTMTTMNRTARIVADLVAGLKDAQQSNKSSLQILSGAAQTYDQTLTLASAGKA